MKIFHEDFLKASPSRPPSVVMEDEPTPPDRRTNFKSQSSNPAETLADLQKLVKALEEGGYNSQKAPLTNGSPLQVEDLAPTMRVVTFDDGPNAYVVWARRCRKLAKFCRFFHLYDWEDMLGEAAAFFDQKGNVIYRRFILEAQSRFQQGRKP